MVLLVVASAPAAAQEITNGSFEQSDSEGNPESWSIQAQELSIDLDDHATLDGGQSLRITGNGSRGSAFVKQKLNLGVSGFSGATLRGRIRTRNVSPSATLVAILEGSDGRIFMDDMRDRVVAGDTEWQEYSVYIPASEEATSLTVGALVIGGGTAWFDDLELIQETEPDESDVDARSYVLEALSVMHDHYLHSDDADWDRIRQRGLQAISENGSPQQAHAAVSMMIEQLDDPHADFVRPRDSSGTEEPTSRTVEPVAVTMASERIASIRVPAVPGSASEDAGITYAEHTHQQLMSIDSPDLCGWIVDLRENTGGNMWPMLAAIGPIAGPGVVGQFVGPGGSDVTEWIYRDGAALVSSESETTERTAITTEPFQPGTADLPVAVLVSERTASSGEATAIAFIGRANTRLFGSATGGLATANNGYPLSDGARVVFPIGYMADRHGTIHHPRVQPDENVASEDALEPALSWLQGQPDCAR
ncbi:MAG: S41 family peptidase [Xanthomonadales bacterium]|nr:S41 family peptidase [Xanthomonadales bacterium]